MGHGPGAASPGRHPGALERWRCAAEGGGQGGPRRSGGDPTRPPVANAPKNFRACGARGEGGGEGKKGKKGKKEGEEKRGKGEEKGEKGGGEKEKRSPGVT